MVPQWLLLTSVVAVFAAAPPAPRWRHSAWLAEELTSPRIYWASQDAYLYLLVEANTIGSIRLELDSVDAVVLWVDDITEEPHIQDYHSANGTIFLDEHSNYQLIGGDQNATHTSVAFRRRWNTCDLQDAVLGSDTVRILWSIYPHDPGDDSHSGGSNDVGLDGDPDKDAVVDPGGSGAVHGEKSLLLQSPVIPPIPQGHNIHSWDVLMRNVEINEKMSTQYWCKIFRSPSLSRKSHIIAYEPLILSPSGSMVHHLLLYECSAPTGYLDSYAVQHHAGAPCYSPHMPQDWETCVTPVATWVLGGSAKVLPDHIGIPIGPRQTYFMLEVHYDNPGLRRGIDNSGFRLFHTEEVRQFDAGVMQTGLMVTPLHLVPPQQQRYLSAGLCNDICTNKMLPEKGVKLVSVLLHSHLAGRAMRLRHIRGDREMPRIVEDNQYDFAFQQDRVLKDEVTVFPGDQLLTECEYDTRGRPGTTFGGYSTREEMCLSFVTYYPRTELASCHSMSPVKEVFQSLGIKAFYGRTIEQVERFVLRTGTMPKLKKTQAITTPPKFESDEAAIEQLKQMAEFLEDPGAGAEDSLLSLKIQEPAEFRGRSLARHLQDLPWADEDYTNSFQKSLARGLQMVFCRTRTDTLAVPLNIESFPNFTLLEEEEIQDCLESNPLAEGASSAWICLHLATLLCSCLVIPVIL